MIHILYILLLKNNNKGLINGKIPVYFQTDKSLVFEEKATLCNPENLQVYGFID
jgi:hypothetical protein